MNENENVDFRGDRMESPDGHGYAKLAWEAYKKASNRLLGPAMAPLAKKYAASQLTDLIGFWTIWHVEGGYDGLVRLGMSRSAIYRRIKLCRKVFGMHPDELGLPGIEFSIEEYRKGKPYKREP